MINIHAVAVFLHMMRCVDNGAYAADLFSSRVGKSRGGCERLSLVLGTICFWGWAVYGR